MKIDKSLIESYQFEDYEKSNKIIEEKFKMLSSFSELLTKISLILEKFINKEKEKEKENKKLKKTLSIFDESNNFYSFFIFIQKFLDIIFNESYSMIKKMIGLLMNLKEEIKENFKNYEQFLIYQNEFIIKLNELEDSKKAY